jgi:hypothetical protein
MKLSVHFIYEALIVKPKCRKPNVVALKDIVDIEIKEIAINKFPLAFKVGEKELRWVQNKLWTITYQQVTDEEPT